MGEKITKSFMELDVDGDKALDLAKELSEGFKKALEERLSEKMQGKMIKAVHIYQLFDVEKM